MPKLNTEVPVFLYPGYFWSYYDGAQCIFAGKYCKDGKCDGKHRYDKCYQSADWYYGHYCYQGICMPEVGIGSKCTSHQACGRSGFWLFNSSSTIHGYWVEYFSITSTSDPVLIYSSENSNYTYQENAEKVCSSGWINSTTGTCSEAVTSSNKGEVCTADTDCPTSNSNIYSTWKCGFDGQSRCDLHSGDDKWLDANEKFK